MLEDGDLDRLREVFVTREEYTQNNASLYKDISGYGTRLAVIEDRLKLITWLLAAVGGGVITMLIKMFFGG